MIRRAVVLLLALCALAPASHASTAKGSWSKKVYTSPAGARAYWLYVPATKSKARRPLVMFLHGCLQTAEQAAVATNLNALAARRNFVVAYPQQNVTQGSSAPLVDGNGEGCWNWFLPQHQTRGAGEPAIVAGIAQALIGTRTANIDKSRVYLAGISAGADLAVSVAASYPDVFAAVAALAGCPYATCTDVSGELAYRQMGSRARVVPMLVEQGTADTLNPLPQSQNLVSSWLATGDLADDGASNWSVIPTPRSITHRDTNQTPSPGSGDPCVRNSNWPCPGGAAGMKSYPYTVEKYASTSGCGVLDFWIIHGMEHAYPHAPSSTVFSDPLGPDMTSAIYDFFTAHPRGACARA